MSSGKILGRWDSVAISIGIVVGVGIFRVPSEVASQLQNPTLIIIAWILGALLSTLGAFCYAELASIYPKSGGDYIYLRECYGRLTAFLFAWSELLITRTGSVAAVAILFGEYFCALVDLPAASAGLMAVLVVVLLSALNFLGLKIGSRLQNIFTILKVLALSMIILAGFATLKTPANSFDCRSLSLSPSLITSVCVAMVPILWTYGGWRDNVFLAGETKEAARSIPFALISTCFIVASIYLAMNVLYLLWLPMSLIQSSRLIASDLLQVLFGGGGAKIVEGLIVILSFGVINALLLTGSRIAHAMAEDNRFFSVLCHMDRKTMTPRKALFFNCLWSCVLILLTGRFERLIYFTGLAVWIFFAMVAISIIILRRRQENSDENQSGREIFRVPGYPLTPILVAGVSFCLAAGTIYHEPGDSLTGIVIVLAGIPVFVFQGRRRP
ncbi:MAG: amino acid permease [Candidatus Melainabacteria bacterium]|nr:amino acid permease [Candidatus Melainabacteria bacterium]